MRPRRPGAAEARRSPGRRAGRRTSTGCAPTWPPPCSPCPRRSGGPAGCRAGWTPIELLSHVLHMEQRWFVWGFLGEPVDEPWGDWTVDEPWDDGLDGRWQVAEDVTAEALAERLAAIGERTRRSCGTSRSTRSARRAAGSPTTRRRWSGSASTCWRSTPGTPASSTSPSSWRPSARREMRRPVPPSGPKPSARNGPSRTEPVARPPAPADPHVPRSTAESTFNRNIRARRSTPSPREVHRIPIVRQRWGSGERWLASDPCSSPSTPRPRWSASPSTTATTSSSSTSRSDR